MAVRDASARPARASAASARATAGCSSASASRARALCWSAHNTPDATTQRRLHRLELAYRAKQAPVDMLDRITSAEAAMQETYSTFRAQFDGHAASDNELEDILRNSTNSVRVQAAWEARKQIGSV